MPISAPYGLTDCQRFFAKPATPRQRQYEALRAFYLEGLPSAECARRFGYSAGAFRVLCHAFRRGDLPEARSLLERAGAHHVAFSASSVSATPVQVIRAALSQCS